MMFVLFQNMSIEYLPCAECGPRGYKSERGPFPISEELEVKGVPFLRPACTPGKLYNVAYRVGWWPWLGPGRWSCFWTMIHARPLLPAAVGQSHTEFPKFTHLATCHSPSAWELPVPAVTLQICLAEIPSLGKEAHCILEQEWIYFPKRGLLK